MRNLFPKITAILLGAVFLLGGSTTVFGAEYFFNFQESSFTSPNKNPLISSPSYTNAASCEQAKKEKKDDGFDVFQCTTNTEARSSTRAPEDNALFKKLNCNPVGSVIGGVFGGEGTLFECIPVVTYYIIYKPASWLLTGSGFVFDAMLTLSIDSDFINQEFVQNTWVVVRDFSNMLFIFILLYTGVQTVLGMGNWRKTVLMVIVMALLINFSLFFTKVVIDAGNVLAVGIYSSMGTPKPTEFQSFQSPGKVEERDISGSLAGAFHPERFLKVSGDVDALDATIVFLIASAVSGYAGYIFFKASLLFIGRLVAFWFLMIVSPFAFISLAFSSGAQFQKWLHELLNQAFVAPVFLFLIYLIMKVVSAGDGILGALIKESGSDVGAFTFDKVLAPVVIATILIYALGRAYDLAKDMSGKFGGIGTSLVGKPLGLAAETGLAVATGGASLLGRATAGRLAQGLYERGTFAKMATNTEGNAASRMVGRSLIGLNEKARTGTWDARGVGAVQKAAKAGGLSLGAPSANAKGGYEGSMKRQDQADKKFAEKLQLGTQEKEAIKEKVSTATKIVEEKKTIAKTAAEAFEKANADVQTYSMNNAGKLDPGLSNILEKARKEKEDAENALAEAEKETVKTAEDIIKETEQARRDSYADYIEKRGEILGKIVGGAGVAGAVAGGMALGPLGAAAAYSASVFGHGSSSYSNEQARRTAEKLRKGGDDAKAEKKDKFEELIEKTVKERLEKVGH